MPNCAVWLGAVLTANVKAVLYLVWESCSRPFSRECSKTQEAVRAWIQHHLHVSVLLVRRTVGCLLYCPF